MTTGRKLDSLIREHRPEMPSHVLGKLRDLHEGRHCSAAGDSAFEQLRDHPASRVDKILRVIQVDLAGTK
jgi:hypothetical protein